MVPRDAARTRDRVLGAARTLVARDGAEVRMDDIAEAAGVAVGTLYRHFATKQALVAAVVEHSLDGLAEQAQQAAADVDAGADPWTVLEDLLRRFAASAAEDRAVKTAGGALGADLHPDLRAEGTGIARALAAVDTVLARARAAGSLQDDVTTEDLVVVLSQVPDEAVSGPGSRERYLRLVLRGMAR